MSEALAVKADSEFRGPGDGVSPQNPAGTATSSTTSAANLDTGLVTGGRFLSLQARGGDVYIRFKTTTTTAATTSGNASNGVKIPDGTTVSFYIGPASRFVDHIASASSCTLFWWLSSPAY